MKKAKAKSKSPNRRKASPKKKKLPGEVVDSQAPPEETAQRGAPAQRKKGHVREGSDVGDYLGRLIIEAEQASGQEDEGEADLGEKCVAEEDSLSPLRDSTGKKTARRRRQRPKKKGVRAGSKKQAGDTANDTQETEVAQATPLDKQTDQEARPSDEIRSDEARHSGSPSTRTPAQGKKPRAKKTGTGGMYASLIKSKTGTSRAKVASDEASRTSPQQDSPAQNQSSPSGPSSPSSPPSSSVAAESTAASFGVVSSESRFGSRADRLAAAQAARKARMHARSSEAGATGSLLERKCARLDAKLTAVSTKLLDEELAHARSKQQLKELAAGRSCQLCVTLHTQCDGLMPCTSCALSHSYCSYPLDSKAEKAMEEGLAHQNELLPQAFATVNECANYFRTLIATHNARQASHTRSLQQANTLLAEENRALRLGLVASDGLPLESAVAFLCRGVLPRGKHDMATALWGTPCEEGEQDKVRFSPLVVEHPALRDDEYAAPEAPRQRKLSL